MIRRPPRSTLFPYTTLFRSLLASIGAAAGTLVAYWSRRLLPGNLALATPLDWRVIGFVGGLTLRSEEHTSELQSQSNLVCRLLLAKKNNTERNKHAYLSTVS